MGVILRSEGVEKRGELVVLEGLTLAEDTDGHPVIRGSVVPTDGGTGTGVTAVCAEVAMHAAGYDLELVNVPATLTDLSPRSHQWFNAVGFTRARVVAQVTTAGSSGTLIVAQYTYDGGATWRFLDGASGPTLAIDTTGALRGGWVSLEPSAQGDITVRWASYGGDGSTTPVLGKLAVEFEVVQDITGDGDDPNGGDPTGLSPLAWHLSDQQFTAGQWSDLSGNENHLTPSTGSPTTTGATLNGRQTLHFDNSVLQWPTTLYSGRAAGEGFVVFKLGAGSPSSGVKFLDTFTSGSDAAVLGHVPDTGSGWQEWVGPYDESPGSLDPSGLRMVDGMLYDKPDHLSGTGNLLGSAALTAQMDGTLAVGDEVYLDLTLADGITSGDSLEFMPFVSPNFTGGQDDPLNEGVLQIQLWGGDVYCQMGWGMGPGEFSNFWFASESYTMPWTPGTALRIGVTVQSADIVDAEDPNPWQLVVELWTEPLGGGTRTVLGPFTLRGSQIPFTDTTHNHVGLYTGSSFANAAFTPADTSGDWAFTESFDTYASTAEALAVWATESDPGNVGTWTLDTTHVFDGTFALRCNLNGGYNGSGGVDGTLSLSCPVTGLAPNQWYEIRYHYYRTGVWGFGPLLNQWVDFTGGSLGQPRFMTTDASGNGTLTLVAAVGGGPNAGADVWFDGIRLVAPPPNFLIDQIGVTGDGGGGGGGGDSYLWRLGTGAAPTQIGTVSQDNFGASTTQAVGSAGIDGSAFHLWNVRSSLTEWTAAVDGVQLFSTATNNVAFTSTPLFGGSDVGLPASLDVAEVLLFDRILSETDRNTVHSSMNSRWDLGLPVVATLPPGGGGDPPPAPPGALKMYLGSYDTWTYTPPFYANLAGGVYNSANALLTELAQHRAGGMTMIWVGMPHSAGETLINGKRSGYNHAKALAYVRMFASVANQLQSYFDDGTLHPALYLIDEPSCTNCWHGTTPTPQQVDELAFEYRKFLPKDMGIHVRLSADALLDWYTGWQYITGCVNVYKAPSPLVPNRPSITEYIQTMVALMRPRGWRAWWNLNMTASGDGSSGIRDTDTNLNRTAYFVSADEVATYGVPMAQLGKDVSVGMGYWVAAGHPQEAPNFFTPAYMASYNKVYQALIKTTG